MSYLNCALPMLITNDTFTEFLLGRPLLLDADDGTWSKMTDDRSLVVDPTFDSLVPTAIRLLDKLIPTVSI